VAKSKVSDGFKRARAKHQNHIQDAKKAENTMQTCKMPVGWSGQAVIVDGVADQAKDRKDETGKTIEGRPYIRLEFEVINDPEYAGAKFARVWSFFDSDKASFEDRYSWWLNDMENWGLPREDRETFEQESEIIDFFVDGNQVFNCEVNHNKILRGDKKEIVVTPAEAVDESDSMAPEEPAAPKASSKESPSPEADEPDEAPTVKYMGKDWDLLDEDGDDLLVRSRTTGKERTIKRSEVE
jgi:hypothetical protein